jgi:hypothetical protein
VVSTIHRFPDHALKVVRARHLKEVSASLRDVIDVQKPLSALTESAAGAGASVRPAANRAGLRRSQQIERVLLPKRVWALRMGEHVAAIHVKAVPGIGAEIVLTVDGEWRRSRLFRSHEKAELVSAIADTRATFEAKGWA